MVLLYEQTGQNRGDYIDTSELVLSKYVAQYLVNENCWVQMLCK